MVQRNLSVCQNSGLWLRRTLTFPSPFWRKTIWTMWSEFWKTDHSALSNNLLDFLRKAAFSVFSRTCPVTLYCWYHRFLKLKCAQVLFSTVACFVLFVCLSVRSFVCFFHLWTPRRHSGAPSGEYCVRLGALLTNYSTSGICAPECPRGVQTPKGKKGKTSDGRKHLNWNLFCAHFSLGNLWL